MKDIKNLVKYILYVFLLEDKIVVGVIGIWFFLCFVLVGILIIEIVNFWDLFGGFNGKIYDECVVLMILLLKLIDVYYWIGVFIRIFLFFVGDFMWIFV